MSRELTASRTESATIKAAASQELQPSLAAERRRNVHIIGLIRFWGVSLFFALSVFLGAILDRPEWQGNLLLFTGYWVLTAAFWLVGRGLEDSARVGSLALCFLDMPMVFLLQRAALPTSPSPSGVAGFTIGIFVLLVILVSMSLETWQIFVAAAIGAVLEIWLQHLAGVGTGGKISAALLMALTAAGCLYSSKRAIALVEHVVRDFIEQKQMQKRLLISNRMVSLGTLVAGIAHEINNPMAYVIANLEFLSEKLDKWAPSMGDPVSLSKLKEILETTRQGTERVRKIVSSMKAFSRADDQKLEPVDVHKVLESAMTFAANEIRHRANLVRNYREVPRVWADESRLGQVFLNLLVNAAQAIPAGAAARNEIAVSIDTDGLGCVVIEVEDTGSGIAPEAVSRLFDPFFTTKPVGVGTGLGLSICRGIITSFGGEIGVRTELGKGSTFRVSLPAFAEQGRTRREANRRPSDSKSAG